jgi:hypothetical protein
MSDFMKTMPLAQKIVHITTKEIEQTWEDDTLIESLREIAKATEGAPYPALGALLGLARGGKINLRKYDWNKEQETFAYGYKIGVEIAEENAEEIMNSLGLKPNEIGDSCSFWEELGECVTHFECYSPWEFFAKDLNDDEDSEELWEAYGEGIDEGMTTYVKTQVEK